MLQAGYFDKTLLKVKSSQPARQVIRLHILDSIRGWASVQVLVFHVCSEMFSAKLPEFKFNGILEGAFAVAIFFVLSGEALSYAYFVKKDINIVRKQAIKRYLRLTIPISVSCFMVFLLMKENLIFSHEVAPFLERTDWLGKCVNFDASFKSLISYAFFGVFFNHTTDTSYNPFLWTMSIELFGSVLLFLVLFLAKTSRQRYIIYIILAPFLIKYNPYLGCFIFGMLFGELRASGFFRLLCAQKATNWIALLVIIAVIMSSFVYPSFLSHDRYFSFAAAFFLFAIYCSKWLQVFFDNRLSHFLGEMSFPIYLIHFPVIISLQSYMVLLLFPNGIVTREGAIIIIGVTVCTSLFVAYCFRPVERFAIKASNAFFVFIDRA
jgi:peptidoglycan/LPS O-acetylase OafA/YrhL